MACIRQAPTGQLDIELSGDGEQFIFGWVSEGDDFRRTLSAIKEIPAGDREWWEESTQWVVSTEYEWALAQIFSNWGEAVEQARKG